MAALLSSAELYDPASGTWSGHRQPRHRTLRSHGDAAALRQGAGGGGIRSAAVLSSAELYDPATGRGARPAASAPHAPVTRRRCCPQARCWWRGELDGSYLEQRGAVRSGDGKLDGDRQPRHRTRAITRRRCCPTARCWWRGDRMAAAFLSSAELYDPASGTLEQRPAASAPHATITRRRCCPTARCWWQEEYGGSRYLSSAELYDPATGRWSGDRQPRHRTRRSHGDAAALRQGAGGGGIQ